MAKVRKTAVKEANRFAARREELFQSTRDEAKRKLAAIYDPAAMMRNPTEYLRGAFVAVGSRLIREQKGRAEAAGKDHAARLQPTEHPRP